MDKNGKVTSGPYWTQNWIEAMWRFTAERFVNFDTGAVDFEALGREEYEFRKALFFRNFKNSPRAKMVFDEANEEYKKKVENGSKGGRPRKESTADGDTREDSQGTRTAAAITRNEPLENDHLDSSANLYGEAATSDGADVSTTFSNNSEALVSQRRAGADSVRGTPSHSAPARPRAKNSRCPNSREDFHAFVADNNLHEGLAEEWYAIHEAREWVDKNGNPIKDWRGALYNYCSKTEQKRRKP